MKFSKKLLSATLFGFSLATFTICSTLAYADTYSDKAFQEASQAYEKQDYKTAYNLFLPLAKQGNAEAQETLGHMYSVGNGVATSNEEAVKWFRKAAEQGRGSAQFFLGLMYESGLGVPKDEIKAKKWYKKACQNGMPVACKG